MSPHNILNIMLKIIYYGELCVLMLVRCFYVLLPKYVTGSIGCYIYTSTQPFKNWNRIFIKYALFGKCRLLVCILNLIRYLIDIQLLTHESFVTQWTLSGSIQ